MKGFTTSIILFVCTCVNLCINAQDIHSSDYRFNQLLLNPANAGSFSGDIRAGLSYRDQFRTFIGEAYTSAHVWADSPVSFVINKKQWIGAGFHLFMDRTGDLGLSRNGAAINLGYHYSFDDDYSKIIGLGIQYGQHQFKLLSEENAIFSDDNGMSRSQDHDLLTNFDYNYATVNIGLNYKQIVASDGLLELGLSIYNANQPKINNTNSTNPSKVKSRFNSYARYFANFSTSWNGSLSLITSFMGTNSNVILKSDIGFSYNEDNENKINFGLGYRLQDALLLSIGMEYKSWIVGLNYDLTISSASNYNNTVGGVELGIIKYFQIHKKPEVKPELICPRL